MYAYDKAVNAGRYGTKSYTLKRLLELRASLLNGVDKASPITILTEQGSMHQACQILESIVKANVSETGKVKSIEGVAAEVILENLEKLSGQDGYIVVNGNTRALAVLLNEALGGEPIELETVTYEGNDAALASFRANAASALTLAMDWKARTAAVIPYIASSPLTVTEAMVGKHFNLKRGNSQHAFASAKAVIAWDLDLDKCQSLSPAQWRDVKGASGQAAAEALAYGTTSSVKAWSPRQLAVKALADKAYSPRHLELLNILATGTVEEFASFLK